MAKTRSPNYPQLSFGEAIEKAKLVYKSAHQHSITDEVIANALGYISLNGRSLGVISAIKKYGLLIPEGDGFKISEDAFNIFELPSNTKEYIESFQKMAFTPQIFVEIRETYGENLPSDQILRHYLIKNKFNPNVADEVIKNFRSTTELVRETCGSYNNAMKTIAPQTPEVLPPEVRIKTPLKFYGGGYATSQIETSIEEQNPNQELKFRISNDSEVKVIFKGEVTQQAIKKLIGFLEFSMDTFPENSSQTDKVISQKQPSLLDTNE